MCPQVSDFHLSSGLAADLLKAFASGQGRVFNLSGRTVDCQSSNIVPPARSSIKNGILLLSGNSYVSYDFRLCII